MKVKIVVTHLLNLADILRHKIVALVDNPSYAIISAASLISAEDNSYLCHSFSAVNGCDNSSNASFLILHDILRNEIIIMLCSESLFEAYGGHVLLLVLDGEGSMMCYAGLLFVTTHYSRGRVSWHEHCSLVLCI